MFRSRRGDDWSVGNTGSEEGTLLSNLQSFALTSVRKMSHGKMLELPLVRSLHPDGSLQVISLCHNRESGERTSTSSVNSS